jgi:hypothetical protein
MGRLLQLAVPVAIFAGSLIIAATIAVVSRWNIVTGPTTGESTETPIRGIYRLDRWTGKVTWYRAHGLPGLMTASFMDCEAEPTPLGQEMKRLQRGHHTDPKQ